MSEVEFTMDASAIDGKPKKPRAKKAVQEAAVEKVMKTINIKDFLAMSKAERPSALISKTVKLKLTDEVEVAVEVRQLTANEVGLFNRRILGNMPQAPLIEQTTTQASRDPVTGKVKPAGTYKETNPSDPGYIKEMEIWFNNAAIWLALFSAHEALDLDMQDESFDEKFDSIQDELPPSSLMAIALAASEVNPGLPIADEIQKQFYQSMAEMQLTREYAEVAGTLQERSENETD